MQTSDQRLISYRAERNFLSSMRYFPFRPSGKPPMYQADTNRNLQRGTLICSTFLLSCFKRGIIHSRIAPWKSIFMHFHENSTKSQVKTGSKLGHIVTKLGQYQVRYERKNQVGIRSVNQVRGGRWHFGKVLKGAMAKKV